MMALNKSTGEMRLSYLLDGLVSISAVDDRSIINIKNDSREIQPGDLFFACKGQRSNGSQYIDDAIALGCCAVVVDAELEYENKSCPVPVIEIKDLSSQLGQIADRFYQHPSSKMNVIGITGTNGKTSTAHFIAQALSLSNSAKAGVIGTLGIGPSGDLQASLNTTPDALTIHSTLYGMLNDGIQNVVMEVSSHALTQSRVGGVNFDIGVFTNLSHEHLDYHGDMESYAEAKRLLFLTESLASAVINIDDEYGQQLIDDLPESLQLISFSIGEHATTETRPNHVNGKIVESGIGLLLIDVRSPWGEGTIETSLTGSFNAGNLLAALSVLCLSGISFEDIRSLLSKVQSVPGRMECFGKNGFARVIVDYAHTPDALEKALISLHNIKKGKLICVVGCGGDRDQGKRPVMGKIAATYADQIVLTNDNPRNEKPEDIIEQILVGIDQTSVVTIIQDRTEAIRSAIASASEDDVILVAGKGHETYQEIAGVRLPFSDRQLVRNLLEQSE